MERVQVPAPGMQRPKPNTSEPMFRVLETKTLTALREKQVSNEESGVRMAWDFTTTLNPETMDENNFLHSVSILVIIKYKHR